MVHFRTDQTEHDGLEAWVDRIAAEYREMPCLSLTRPLNERP